MVIIMLCSCEHEYQDKKYGKYRRIFNSTKKNKIIQSWRCTVCGHEK